MTSQRLIQSGKKLIVCNYPTLFIIVRMADPLDLSEYAKYHSFTKNDTGRNLALIYADKKWC